MILYIKLFRKENLINLKIMFESFDRRDCKRIQISESLHEVFDLILFFFIWWNKFSYISKIQMRVKWTATEEKLQMWHMSNCL